MTVRVRGSPRVFIGYGGPEGEKIAEDICEWLRKRRVEAFTVTPKFEDSIPLLASEEKVPQVLSEFDLAVMVCTKGAVNSSRYRDETEKLVYELEMPTVAFAMLHTPILNILQLRTRVYFSRKRHKKAFGRLLRVLKTLDARPTSETTESRPEKLTAVIHSRASRGSIRHGS